MATTIRTKDSIFPRLLKEAQKDLQCNGLLLLTIEPYDLYAVAAQRTFDHQLLTDVRLTSSISCSVSKKGGFQTRAGP